MAPPTHFAFRVSTRTRERWRLTDIGPRFVKLGKRVVYRPTDLDDFVESRVTTSTRAT